MKLLITCKYCDHKEEKITFNSTLDDLCCTRCGDKNIIAKSIDEAKINYYAGSPEFVTFKKIEKDTKKDKIEWIWD